MHRKTAGNQIVFGRSLRKCITVAVDLDEFSMLRELLQPAIKIGSVFSMQPQFAHQLFVSGRSLGLARDVFQNCGVGKHGDGVVGRSHNAAGCAGLL